MAQVERQEAPSETLTHAEGTMALGAPESADAEPLALRASPRVSSPGRDAWRRFRRNWAAMASLAIVIVLVILAAFAQFMHTMSPIYQSPCYCHLDIGPSPHHLFGTDGTGEDLYSRVIFGLRVPLIVGLVGTLITVFLGTLIGLVAGYFGSVVDQIFSRITDFFFAFPAFLLAILCVVLFGRYFDSPQKILFFTFDPNAIFAGAGRVVLLTIVFSVVSWPSLMRFVRGLALSMKETQYIEAARTSGSSSWKIIRRHMLPNMFGLILVQAALITVGIVYTETALSIFGLGVLPPYPDLGQMLYDASQNLNGTNIAPGFYAEAIFPAAFLAVLLIAFTFIGDGVRDAVDPRMNA